MFYTIGQNNSGGSNCQDSMVNHLVCVEANSVKEASEKLERITDHYNQNSCPCCGELIERVDNREYGNIYIARNRCFETLEEAVEHCCNDEGLC